ncbi:hypothetical protein [Streptomyces roseolilacinus]|uniref:Uncharacterized protein n=1 Tax=Streptomyces roseolilacinus TaxID=66904 RepID=A0A918AZI5_9ACTN|nr:hypothetical protein [Streptomyces roseolilacinus]GGQ07096.1 hypothetical protein GCM10010249_26670 [Streptomyces roseolilacinus]
MSAPTRAAGTAAELERAERAVRAGGPAADAAVTRLARVAGPALRGSTLHALREALRSGRWHPVWDDGFRVVRTSARPWVVAVPDPSGAPLPRLLWTEPWTEGARQVAWARRHVPSATGRLYGYAGEPAASLVTVARLLRHPRPGDLVHPLGRLGVSPCGSGPGCLCCPGTEVLVADPGARAGGPDARARARWVALAAFLGREGSLHPTRTASRGGTAEDRNAAAVLTGLLAGWLYLSTCRADGPPPSPPARHDPPARHGPPGAPPCPPPGRAAEATMAAWRSYAGEEPSRADSDRWRGGARRLLRDAVRVIGAAGGAEGFGAWLEEAASRGAHPATAGGPEGPAGEEEW